MLRDTLNSIASVSLHLSRDRLLLEEVYKCGYFQRVNEQLLLLRVHCCFCGDVSEGI